MRTELYIGKKRYNIYLGTKRYFFYIANKVIGTILEFLSLPAKFISNKAQELLDYKIYGNTDGVGDRTLNTLDIWSMGVKSQTDKSGERNGVTWEVLEDGGIKLNGTNTGSSNLDIYFEGGSGISSTQADRYNTGRKAGTYYIRSLNGDNHKGNITGTATLFTVSYDDNLSQMVSVTTSIGNVADKTFTLNSDSRYTRCLFRINAGTTLEDFIIYPMIVLDSYNGDFEPFGYKVPMQIIGNNVFNPQNIITGYLGQNGYVANANFRTFFFPVKGGQSYTITKTFASYRFIVKGFKSIPTASTLEDQTISVSNTTLCRFTADEDINYVLIFGWHTSDTKTVEEIANSIMVNTGLTALPYEPYIGEFNNKIFINKPLYKVGDYVDYLDYKNQKLIRNVDSETMTGLTVPIEEDIELVPSNIPEGTLTINVDTSVMPSKVIIEGDIANE